MNRSGFTLIELLTVIAIISVLAAILFPVFIEVKSDASKTSCVSNLRQTALANMLYTQDADETFQSASVNVLLGPNDPLADALTLYVSSSAVLRCPNRRDADCAQPNGMPGSCIGFGFNWGFYNPWDDGIGLLEPATQADMHTVVLAGKPTSALSEPASTFLAGDTWSSPPYTLAVYDDWNGPGSARHLGAFNFVYTDGHAKSLRQRHGFTAADTYVVGNQNRTHSIGEADTLSPANSADLKSYCSAPDSPDCAEIVAWFLANTTFDSLQ